MVVAGDYVTGHMSFPGHFPGRFGQKQGQGQPISFRATDLVKIENGRITDNWHIEDNLTLLLEMGVAKVGSYRRTGDRRRGLCERMKSRAGSLQSKCNAGCETWFADDHW